MIKRFYILLLAIVASVGVSWATDPIVIATNTEQSSYTQGSITVSVNYVGDSDGFRLNNDNSASISNSGSSTISKIELVPGWFLNKHSYVRANGAEPNSSSEELITFLNVNSNEVTLSCSVSICIKEVRIYFEEAASAKLPGAFTINADGDKIVFSKGNLQATTTDLGANWTWDFAPNQWSLIGNAVANNAINGNKKVSANGTVDLFGWSTAATYYGINESWKNDDYAGDFVDWGALMGTEWRTLSRAEFYYIVYSRTDAYKKRGQATVNGVPGYVLLPDAWTLPSGLSFTPNAGNYTTNQYDGADWTAMESAGAVFLPAAGVREGTDIYQVNLYGWYWASTPNETDGGKAYYLWFDKSSQGVTEYNRWKSKSVRLVTEAPIPPYEAAIKLINAIGTVELTAECKAKIDTARTAYDALSTEDKALVTNYTTLTQAETDYAALNQAEADKVVAKINNIPTTIELKLATRDSIEGARAAYDALTADQKALVTNYAVLEAAEATMATLNPGGGAPLPEGALTGAFSINADGDKIAFSKGNLQATTANLGETWTWAFAAHQYDYIGDAVANTAITGSGTVSANGTVDLFGWSTAATYYGINNSKVSGKHPGDFIDWGETIAEGWRTLTRDEWNYLFETRTDAASKYGRATVAGIHGIIVLPDSYKGTAINADHSDWSDNTISAEDWAAYEANGVAFLPAAGSRLATSMNYVGEYAFYWTSTTYGEKWAYRVRFVPNLSPDYGDRVPGQSVRLVTAHTGNPTPLDSAQAVKDLIDAIPVPVTLNDSDAVQAARDAYNALAEATKGALDDATVQKLNQAITDYTALIQAEVDEVIAKIANIPQPVTLKLATRDSIESARAAYDALTADQQALVSNYPVLTAAEAALAALNPGGGAPAGALNGKFTINAGGDQIAFAKGNLQATTTDLGEHWTWGFAANQWDYLGIVVANNKITGNKTVSENGTVDLFGWSTAATYYGINKSYTAGDYNGDFVDWGPNMSAGWRTLTKDEWNYLIENNTKGRATVNDKSGYIFLPNDWSGPAFTPDPDNFTTNVYSGDDWTAMENAGAVFLPSGPARNGTYALIANDARYYSSTSLNNDSSYVFTIYYNQSQSACTGTNRAYGCMVRLVTEGGGATPLDSALAVKDLIDAIPVPVTLNDSDAIQAARAGYDALSDNAKGALDPADVKKLTDAEKALKDLNQAEADKVVAKINNIPTPVELKLATRDSIESARAAYDALTADQQALVSNYTKLTNAEAALASLNPGVPPATPLDSAQAVKDLIDAIPTPVEYPTSGAAIAAALVAYQQLSDAAKGALDDADVQKMTDAAAHYAALDAIAAIDAIPAEIVYDPAVKAAIETARDKFDKLIDASKAYVGEDKVQKLTKAEEAWAILVAKIEHNVSYIGKDGELKNEKVALLHIPDPAPEFNGYEFVRWDVKAGNFLEEGLRVKAIYTPIITTDPEAIENLMYNGTAQTLITAGVAKEGHIEYRINDGEWSAELPKATNAAAYVVYYKLVREGHEDYLADPINVTIAKAPVTYTAPTAVENLVYNASNQTLIAAGQTNDGTFEYSLDPTLLDSWKAELPQAKDAGTYSVYYRVQGDLNHLDSVAATQVAVTIAKAKLTATADDKNVIYGDAVPAYTVTYAGWQGNDDASVLTGDIAFACTYAPTSNVGEYTITPSGVDAANYTITFVNGKVTVAQALLTVTAENKTVTYGDAVPTYTATYSGFKNTDGASVVSGLVYTCEYAPTSNVGEYTIVPGGATATNYSFAYVNGKVTVNKAALMITADDKNVIYGDAVPEYTATYSGWKNSDDKSVVSGLVYTCAYAPTSNVGEYVITPSGATATNYEISYTNGKVTVAKADLMITADDKNVIYGDAVPTYTATYSGWKNEDNESVVSNLAYTCEYAPTSNVGEYTITPNSATATNYAISYTNGKVTVAQATLTVTAEDKQVTYGDAAPAFTVTYSGWKNSDDKSVVSGLTLTSEYLVTSNVGTYDIVPANATALNYTFVYVNGTLTVNKATLMITADDKSVEYGDEHPEFTASYSGWKNSEGPSVVSGLTLTSEYLVTSNVGTYDIVPANATALNYAISFTNGTLTVNQAPLMITADDKSVIYGEVAPEFTASYSGWKNSDDKSVVSGLTLTSEYLVTSNVGAYDIVPANASATNYAISFTNGTLTVNQAALTITANDTVMIYGDEHPEFTASYSGWKNTDDESVVSGLQFSTPYTPGSYIGTYAINPNSATALNYAITFVDGTLTVNKAHVYVSDAEAQIAKFADGHANAVVLQQGTLNGIKLNDPIAHVTTAAFSSADVAENLTITLFYELTGDAALLNNYNLDPTSDIFTTEGVIIEPFIPDDETEPEDQEATVNEGIEIYAYGYCDGSGYSLKYHLESGNPDQYKIEFEDSRFTDVDWTNLEITGKDGTIDIEIPVDLPTGDYTMTVYFRDSRFDWLESRQFNVTFHVNLPETYVRPLFDNVIALVDTCNCLTDIQWYWRANSSEPWQPIEGANGYYYHADGKLTGEYFVSAKMNGEPTYTCGQADMETLYGEGQQAQAPVVRAYPNPVVNTTTVTIENSDAAEHTLRIVNLMGAEVLSATFEGTETKVEMGTFVQGNYMISVDGVTVKVLKK